MAAILKNRYDVILRRRLVDLDKIWQGDGNDTPMTMNRSKSKPEVDVQYSSRLFSETGISNN